MEIHNYSPQTGEYLGASVARPDPLEDGRYLVPANATTESPPSVKDFEVAVYNNGWAVKKDYRGVKYWDTDKNQYEIKDIDEVVPEGYISVAPPEGDVKWGGTSWVKSPPTPQQVNIERSRRLVEGSTISVTSYGEIPVQGRDQDQITILALEASAKDLKAAGVTTAAIPFRDRDNGSHMLTPDQTIELMAKAKQYAQAIYQASWALKDMTKIPEDYKDDKWWP